MIDNNFNFARPTTQCCRDAIQQNSTSRVSNSTSYNDLIECQSEKIAKGVNDRHADEMAEMKQSCTELLYRLNPNVIKELPKKSPIKLIEVKTCFRTRILKAALRPRRSIKARHLGIVDSFGGKSTLILLSAPLLVECIRNSYMSNI